MHATKITFYLLAPRGQGARPGGGQALIRSVSSRLCCSCSKRLGRQDRSVRPALLPGAHSPRHHEQPDAAERRDGDTENDPEPRRNGVAARGLVVGLAVSLAGPRVEREAPGGGGPQIARRTRRALQRRARRRRDKHGELLQLQRDGPSNHGGADGGVRGADQLLLEVRRVEPDRQCVRRGALRHGDPGLDLAAVVRDRRGAVVPKEVHDRGDVGEAARRRDVLGVRDAKGVLLRRGELAVRQAVQLHGDARGRAAEAEVGAPARRAVGRAQGACRVGPGAGVAHVARGHAEGRLPRAARAGGAGGDTWDRAVVAGGAPDADLLAGLALGRLVLAGAAGGAGAHGARPAGVAPRPGAAAPAGGLGGGAGDVAPGALRAGVAGRVGGGARVAAPGAGRAGLAHLRARRRGLRAPGAAGAPAAAGQGAHALLVGPGAGGARLALLGGLRGDRLAPLARAAGRAGVRRVRAAGGAEGARRAGGALERVAEAGCGPPATGRARLAGGRAGRAVLRAPGPRRALLAGAIRDGSCGAAPSSRRAAVALRRTLCAPRP
mmetsp:Transcript_64862/g.169806  ORF Transcript_64862/g.169806 Transcript_64862/m.169806 type:complete len:551 (+) Transcript_64862:302-1954(+)